MASFKRFIYPGVSVALSVELPLNRHAGRGDAKGATHEWPIRLRYGLVDPCDNELKFPQSNLVEIKPRTGSKYTCKILVCKSQLTEIFQVDEKCPEDVSSRSVLVATEAPKRAKFTY